MLDKIYKYHNKLRNEDIYLNGPYLSEQERLLELYVEWFNTEFAPDEGYDYRINKYDFEFIESFCPIDFYDEYRECHKNYPNWNSLKPIGK